MKSVRQTAFLVGVALLMMSGGIIGQEKGTKKEDVKKEDTKKEDVKKEDTKKEDAKKEPTTKTKAKGQLPQNWGQLGLTDEQKQSVYRLQGKHNEEIDTLEAKIKEIKAKISEERMKILTAEQKKRLEEILKAKAGGK